MSRTVYEKRCSLRGEPAIERFVYALLPPLKAYGLPRVPVVVDRLYDCVIGARAGPHLEYTYYDFAGDPYQSPVKTQRIESRRLAHVSTGQPLDVSIGIDDVAWGGVEVHLRFAGEAADVEELKKAVQPLTAGC
ncbi:MAG TPA: hypothetical protein VF546_13000 [Pyrinomonadaceae bacterium]|jgi:hypothetical protein